MALTTSRDLRQDVQLTNISIGYRNAQYIADQICPPVGVQMQSGLVPEYNQSNWFRAQAEKRAPGTKSQRGGFSLKATNKYFCDEYGFGFEIYDQTRRNSVAPWDLDRDGTEFVTDQMQLAREINFGTNMFAQGVWGTDKVGSVDFQKFDDYGASTPLLALSQYSDAVEGKIAVEPNVHVYGKQVFTSLRWHPNVVDNIKYTQIGVVTEELLASILGIKKLLVGRAIYTDDPEGTDEDAVTYKRVWGKRILMVFVTDRPSLMRPSAAYTMVWSDKEAGMTPNQPQYIVRMRDDERKTDIIEGTTFFDQKVTGKRGGLLMDEVIT
jgi:hypothetical protein